MELKSKSTTERKKVLETIEQEMEALKITIEDVFGLIDLSAISRQRKYVDGRMVYAKILKDRGHTVLSIARSLKQNHATILYHIEKSNYIMKHDKELYDKYIKCRSEFLCERELFYKNPSQRDMINRINTLTNQLEDYIMEREMVLMQQNNYKRLHGIIKVLSDRLPEGKELLAERKIKRMLNLEIM